MISVQNLASLRVSKITSFYTGGRRHHYHVVYDDGDEEDYDFEEMEFAAELQYKLMTGTYIAPVIDDEPMSDGEGSLHVPSDDEDEIHNATQKGKRKRQPKGAAILLAELTAKKPRKTLTSKVAKWSVAKSQHTMLNPLESYSTDTEYGASLRAMNETEQVAEVARLNKGVDKGTKIAIKTKLLTVKYKEMVAEKMRQYLIDNRQLVQSMIRANDSSRNLRLLSPEFISVGEWVEVDADRTPGWNSESGVGVVVSVHDAFSDVK